MIPDSELKNIVTQDSYTNSEKALICLAADPVAPRQVVEIRNLLVNSGVRGAGKWNVSSLLAGLGELVARTDKGWEITTTGLHRLAELVGPYASAPAPRVASSLRHHLAAVSNSETKAFVEEAVRCFESRLYRAAVVLSWVGAMSVLYDFIVANHLTAFNAEATRRNSKWKPASNSDDLTRMKEYEFLQTISAISVIGSNVKQELEKRLKLRNACGHPNSLAVGEHMTAAHVESLVLNVFSKFSPS